MVSIGRYPPLLVKGARRTGKTYSIERIGRQLAPAFVKLDFQTDLAAIGRIFDGPTDDVDAIVSRIAEYKRTPLDPQHALLFFDEAQLDEKALNSLRFFSGSHWRVVASGELDFVFQTKRAEVVSIEVKSARNASSKSLNLFMEEAHSPYAIRLSENEFGASGLDGGRQLRSLPLYAAFCIGG